MEKSLNDYLEKIEKYLKPLPVSERVDIVEEIKSEMLELQKLGKSSEEITERLGNPKELAKAYLGDLVVQDYSFSWKKFLALCAYYSLVGFSGIFIIPTLVICAPVFICCGVICPLAGIFKLVDAWLHLHIPYAANIGIYGVKNPFIEFILCVVIGIAFYFIGRGCWKLLLYYIKTVSKTKSRLPS